MNISIVPILLLAMLRSQLANAADSTSSLVGTWQLVSRIDRDAAGTDVPDPSLGSDPVGYYAHLGRYEVDGTNHLVTHILEGAIGPGDVGRRLIRRCQLHGDALILLLEPSGEHSRGITRTLTWPRVSHRRVVA